MKQAKLRKCRQYVTGIFGLQPPIQCYLTLYTGYTDGVFFFAKGFRHWFIYLHDSGIFIGSASSRKRAIEKAPFCLDFSKAVTPDWLQKCEIGCEAVEAANHAAIGKEPPLQYFYSAQ